MFKTECNSRRIFQNHWDHLITYEHDFEIIYDKRSSLTPEDRKMKHDIMSKMYKMTEELAYMVYQIDAFIEAPETKSKLNSSEN